MLMESWYASFRFGFAGAWNNTNPELVSTLQRLKGQCPNLFDNFVPRSEQDDHLISESDVLEDEMHKGAVASIRISDAYFDKYTDLPTRLSGDLSPDDSFFSLLRRAYARDYGQPDRMSLAQGRLEWFARLSFTDM